MVEFLAFFSQNSSGSFHSYINQPITDVDTISYVSSIVFLQLRNNLFTSQYEEGRFLFSHLSSKQILYYVGNQVSHYHNMITLHSTVLEIFNILNKPDILSCIFRCMNVIYTRFCHISA